MTRTFKDDISSIVVIAILWGLVIGFYFLMYHVVGGRLMISIFAGVFAYNHLKDWVKISIKVWKA